MSLLENAKKEKNTTTKGEFSTENGYEKNRCNVAQKITKKRLFKGVYTLENSSFFMQYYNKSCVWLFQN